MDTFAETAIVDHRLSFANQGKQIFLFRLQQTIGSLPFPFSVCSKQTEVPETWTWSLADIEAWTWRHGI
jgi:hypothetical protein